MIRALLVDDEKHCLEILTWQLERICPEVQIIGVCDSADKALTILSTQEVELAFLDIEMPHMNGFELLQRLKKISFEIIFTTAYDMFAVKAFKFSALDYLLKPIDKDELVQAVEKVKEKKNRTILPEQLNILFENFYNHKQPSQKIALPTLIGLEFVIADDIIHCQSEG